MRFVDPNRYSVPVSAHPSDVWGDDDEGTRVAVAVPHDLGIGSDPGVRPRRRLARGTSENSIRNLPDGAETLGAYVLTGSIAIGGMGMVYDARHMVSGERVAIKRVREDLRDDLDVARRFAGEAEAALRIEHPGVIRIFESGTDEEGGAYLVMEHLAGETLAQRVGGGAQLELDEIVSIVTQIAETLAAAHRVGVVHRDIKPDNIFLSRARDGGLQVKLLDFGVAKVSDIYSTRMGKTLGTPWYMPPEQIQNASSADARSDVYSLGCVLYELIAGRVPFVGNLTEVLYAHKRRDPVAPHNYRPIPAELNLLVLSMLRKKPGERPASMDRVVAMLKRAARGPVAFGSLVEETDLARIPTRRPPQMVATVCEGTDRKQKRAWPWVLGGAVLSLLLGGGLAALSLALT